MADPTFVDALAAAVLGVGVFCAGRLVIGARRRRSVERDVDITHVVMGVSMAGMLTGTLAGNWNLVWIVAFSASGCWFAWRTRQGLVSATSCTQGSRHLPGGGHVQHLVASVAMLYMAVAVRWLVPAAGHALAGGTAGGMGGMAGMGGVAATSSSAGVLGIGTPVLAFAVAAVLVLDASISASRVLRSPATAVAVSGASAAPGSTSGQSPVHLPAQVDRSALALAPRGSAACTLVMSLAMAYMFVTMHP